MFRQAEGLWGRTSFGFVLCGFFAVAASNYSGTKAEENNHRRALNTDLQHVAPPPEGEREEIHQIFAAQGFTGEDLELIIRLLCCDAMLWAKIMIVEEYGLSPTPKSASLTALSTFSVFILFGAMRLATLLAVGSRGSCIVATGVTFFEQERLKAIGCRSLGGGSGSKLLLLEWAPPLPHSRSDMACERSSRQRAVRTSQEPISTHGALY